MVTVAQTQCITVKGAAAPPAVAHLKEGEPEERAAAPKRDHKLYLGYFLTPVVWKNAIGFLVLHLLAVYGLYVGIRYGTAVTFLYTVAFGIMCGFGVTVGAHRLFTHRCFKAAWGVRLALVILHTIAGQNCMYIWVRDHRQHHKYSDTDADPHNVNRGFFFSHIGWLMMRKHPDVIKYGHTVDLSDLEADPFVMFQKRFYKTLYFFFALCLPVSIPLLWGEDPWVCLFTCYFARMILLLNGTWLVNSAAHMWGTRPFNKNIEPVESAFVSFVALGEGWHNYHHCFPWDYRASELGSRFDLSSRIIDWLARRGWAYDLKYASESMVRKRALAFGDGSHPVYGMAHIKETDVNVASVSWPKRRPAAAAAAAVAAAAAAAAAGAAGAEDLEAPKDFVQSLPAKEAAAMSLS